MIKKMMKNFPWVSMVTFVSKCLTMCLLLQKLKGVAYYGCWMYVKMKEVIVFPEYTVSVVTCQYVFVLSVCVCVRMC